LDLSGGKERFNGSGQDPDIPDKRDNLEYYRELSKLAYRGQLPV
jgi:hypothetical protein